MVLTCLCDHSSRLCDIHKVVLKELPAVQSRPTPEPWSSLRVSSRPQSAQRVRLVLSGKA